MKRTFYVQVLVAVIMGLFLFSSCDGTKKMEKNPEKITYKVTPEVLEAVGEKVNFKVEAKVPPKYFAKNAVVVLFPEIKFASGAEIMEPKIVVGEKLSDKGYQVISKKNGGTVVYNGAATYLEGMDVSELQMNVFIFTAKEFDKIANYTSYKDHLTVKTPDYVVKLADGVIITSQRIQNAEKAALMAHGYEKITKATKTVNYYYPVNVSRYNANYGMNKGDQAKADKEALKEVLGSADWKVESIVIDGWASPEGEVKSNNRLSDDRALSAKQAFEKDFGKRNETITARGNGEDWDGYIAKLNNSNFPEKAAALAVVNYNTLEERHAAISKLVRQNAKLGTEVLEPLRRATVSVVLLEPKHTDDDLMVLAISYPERLKEPEILYAATLHENDLDKQYVIYQNAIKYFPNSVKAHTNAGAVALMQMRNDEALAHLKKAESLGCTDPAMYNNLGILSARKGNFDEAATYYAKASSITEGKHNQGLIEIARGNFSQAQSLLTNEKCTYALALAQLTAGSTDAAISTLNCMNTKTAESYYLAAVANARKGDKSNMASSLKQAISLNKGLAAVARKDREFIKYYSDSAFLDALK